MTDQTRADFEAHFGLTTRQKWQHPDGSYQFPEIQAKWEGYQAGVRAAPGDVGTAKLCMAQADRIIELEAQLAAAAPGADREQSDSACTDADGCPTEMAVLKRFWRQHQAAAAPEPVKGDLLPPVGSRVLIHLSSQDKWVEHTVTGYYVWAAQGYQVKPGERDAHRVFVRVVDENGYDNARLLSDVRPIA